ncbi:Nuclear transport factor 2 (NTF2) family protein [Melia azedarach]|nr:Nuclear transport factor 2 (NTF2) family protein [Melia azedarach]
MRYEQREEISVSDIDDIVTILKADYENAYFVTGIFTSEIYVKDCIFEDPTISFRGTELYSRNLRLLVPFFEYPSIRLQKIEKGSNSKTNFVLATWKLRTYLKLPWRPLICIDGSTVYELNDEFKIIRHAENWNVSALEAIGQIFTPSN